MLFQTRNLYHLRVNKHTIIPLYLYLEESHVDWMTQTTLNEIIADLKPLVGPKLIKESHIGVSGLGATAMKKAGQSAVEVHRGESYQFAYFLKPTESYDLLIKTRNFVAATVKAGSPIAIERRPTPEPPKRKRGNATQKRASKTKSRPRIASAAKKRKRATIDDDEEDAQMSDAWPNSNSDGNESDGKDEGEDEEVQTQSGAAPTRRSARRIKISPLPIDVDMDETMPRVTAVVVKDEPDDTSALANLLPISTEDDTPTPPSPIPKPPSDHLIMEEEEKPKQELCLTYTGYAIPSRCLCVIAEPWPALPSTAQLVSQATRKRSRRPASPKPTPKPKPLFQADSSDEDEANRSVPPPRSPEPEFDSDDDEGRLRMFSQMINKVGERHSGVAARGGMEEFEDDALYGDADEEGRGI